MAPRLLRLSPADAASPEGREGFLCISGIQDTAGGHQCQVGMALGVAPAGVALVS